MDPVQFKGQEIVLQAPAAWDQSDTQCTPLAVKRSEVNGLPALSSYWKPTPNELLMIANGAHIKFTIVGRGLPPIMLEVERCEESKGALEPKEQP